jgi:hypothetical protein
MSNERESEAEADSVAGGGGKNMEGGWASIVINSRHGVDIFLLSIDTTKK